MATVRAYSIAAKALAELFAGFALTSAAWAENAAFARSTGAKMQLDTRTGTRLAAMGASETIAYSPRWGGVRGAPALPSCTVTADGAVLKTASEEGEVEWSPDTTGLHTLTHTAGGETLTAQFTVLGDDVAQHAGALAASETWGSNRVHLVTADVTVPSGKTLTIERGAVVKFMTGTSLTVNGTCAAYGVIFTHVNDDTAGGDTLMDGDEAKPVMDGYKLSGNIYEDDATEERYTAPQPLTSSISGTVRLKGHKVYLANSSITVNSGATLTLLPGAIIKFASGCSMTVNGTLDAQGTRAAPIVFTSQKDDTWGGDTNGDGEKTYPYAGDWSRIVCGGTVKMNHCRIWYASDTSDYGAIQGTGGTVRFDNGEIAHMVYECVRMNSGSFVSYNSVFRDSSMGFGYYGGSGTYVYNGVVEGCSSACRASNKHFYNTVFYRCPTFLESTSSSCNNCLFFNPPGYGAQSAAQVGQNGNIWGDPLFTDPDNGDFTLSKHSPAIDAGDASVAPELDYWGQPRYGAPDIGIFEYQGAGALSPNDLVAVEVSAEETVTAGEMLNVRWRVTNGGTKEIAGSWRDRVSLTDGASEHSLGTVVSSGVLPVGATNEFRGTFAVPAELEGTWRVRVHVNTERDIYEGTVNVANNTATSERTTVVSVRAESIEDGFKGAVPAGGSASAKFAVSGGEPLVGRIVAPVGTIVYFGDGFAPTAANYSAKARVDANGGVIGIPADVGMAYFTVTTESGTAAEFSITFESGALAVRATNPGSVPSSGKTGVKVMGANFAEGCEAEVLADGVVCAGAVEKTMLVSATELVLTLDCDKLQAGKSYGIRVRTATGETAVLDKAVMVAVAPPQAVLKAKLEVPSTVRQGRTITAYVEYENTGNVDMPAPIFEIVSEGQIFKVDGRLHTNSVKVVGLAAEAPRGTLRPGEPQRLAVQVTCMAADVKWTLKSYHAAQEGAKTAKFSLRELYDDDWVLYHGVEDDETVASLRKAVGATKAEYYVNFGAWMSANGVKTVDYAAVKGAFAQDTILKVDSTAVSQLAATALMAAEAKGGCSHFRTEEDWRGTLDGSIWKLCPTCKKWALTVMATSAAGGGVLREQVEDVKGAGDVYLICHGNNNSVEEPWIKKMGVALLSKGEVLAVNWGKSSNRSALPQVTGGFIPSVVNESIQQLRETLKVEAGRMTLIGHSHGGHVAGNIACNYAFGGRIKRYVGLDVSTTDNAVHADVWKTVNLFNPAAYGSSWYGSMSPDDWLPRLRGACAQSEFYKTSWNMSLEEKEQLFADYNFAVALPNDLYEEGSLGWFGIKYNFPNFMGLCAPSHRLCSPRTAM